jgi:hypothetical protein
VPDLTDLILSNNNDQTLKYINIAGIFVGNGVMDFTDHSLEKTEIQYMIDHQLISNRMELIYLRACSQDFESPRCKFFRYEFDIYLAYINQYSNPVATQISMRPARTPRLRDCVLRRRFLPRSQLEPVGLSLRKRI